MFSYFFLFIYIWHRTTLLGTVETLNSHQGNSMTSENG